MPIRPHNLNPPFNIVRASHVEFGVRDLEGVLEIILEALPSGTRPHPVLAVGEDQTLPASGER